jgi:hypothetical protein
MALGPTHPVTAMTTRNLSGGNGWRMRKADNLTALCIKKNVGASTSHNFMSIYGLLQE